MTARTQRTVSASVPVGKNVLGETGRLNVWRVTDVDSFVEKGSVVFGEAERRRFWASEAEVGKHRRDIARLMAIMPAGTKVNLPEAVRAEVDTFLGLVDEPSRSYMRDLGLGGSRSTMCARVCSRGSSRGPTREVCILQATKNVDVRNCR